MSTQEQYRDIKLDINFDFICIHNSSIWLPFVWILHAQPWGNWQRVSEIYITYKYELNDDLLHCHSEFNVYYCVCFDETYQTEFGRGTTLEKERYSQTEYVKD